MPRFRSVLWLAGLALLSACERPFVDAQTPEIEIVGPDLSTVFFSPDLNLQVSASSFRSVDSVAVNDAPMQYDPDRQVWTRSIRMRVGLNLLRITATDTEGVVGIDTAYAVFLPVSFRGDAPSLPSPRGGHTTTLLQDGSLLVLGGAERAGGNALATGVHLARGAIRFAALPTSMHAARTGHTATLLPDGRVLLIGGSRSDEVDELADLVEPIELFDPRTQTFEIVPYTGPPIRRAFHTAVLRTTPAGTFIDLFGGRGDIRYGNSPFLGIREDLTILEFRNDSLIARSPVPGLLFNHGDNIWGHTQTPLQSITPGEVQRYLITGSDFREGAATDVAFVVDYTTPAGIISRTAAAPLARRTRHAAAWNRPGYVAIFGGMAGSPANALSQPELYVEEADRFFSVPEPATGLIKRFGLTATKTLSDRILLIGGFSADGNGIVRTEVFEAASL